MCLQKIKTVCLVMNNKNSVSERFQNLSYKQPIEARVFVGRYSPDLRKHSRSQLRRLVSLWDKKRRRLWSNT